jgi:hypothetical protein
MSNEFSWHKNRNQFKMNSEQNGAKTLIKIVNIYFTYKTQNTKIFIRKTCNKFIARYLGYRNSGLRWKAFSLQASKLNLL